MKSEKPTIVPCPQCGLAVTWGEMSPFRPFCSKRCQLIDLGEWANEEKSIPAPADISNDDHWSESSET